ncbi:MAG: signal recognition particle protein, partial [Algoriella sp.]
AGGSGTSLQEVNQLLKQFSEMGKMMKFMNSANGKKMMETMSKNAPAGGFPGMPKM